LRAAERAILRQDSALDLPSSAALEHGSGSIGPGRQFKRALSHRTLAAIAVTAAVLVAGSAAAVTIGPPSRPPGPGLVSFIDASRDTVTAVTPGVSRPGGIAYGAGATWVTDTAHDQLLRIGSNHAFAARPVTVGAVPADLAVEGNQVVATVLPSLAGHRGGTLTVVATNGNPVPSPDGSHDPALTGAAESALSDKECQCALLLFS